MAEIGIRRYKPNLSITRQISIYVLALVILPYTTYSQQPQNNKQNKRIIEIVHCDSLGQNGSMGSDFKRLLGHVELKHNDMLMFCDSAHHYPATKQVKAFSRVHIKQGDTLDLYGNYLFYDGIEGKAFMEGKVELVDKKTHLYTKTIDRKSVV
jgi:hypothetical protein